MMFILGQIMIVLFSMVIGYYIGKYVEKKTDDPF